MRFVSWNIRQGAPKRGVRVAEALLAHEPSLIVLTEFHPASSRPMGEALAAAGLEHQVASPAGYGLEVFIASAHPLEGPMPLVGQQPMVGGYAEVYMRAADCVVAGVYVPVISAVPLTEQQGFGRCCTTRPAGIPTWLCVMGDWNTGDVPLDKEDAGSPFSCTPEYRRMKSLGYEEAWRAIHGDRREYARQRLVDARYSHEERLAKISDHSIMIVDLAPDAYAPRLSSTTGLRANRTDANGK